MGNTHIFWTVFSKFYISLLLPFFSGQKIFKNIENWDFWRMIKNNYFLSISWNFLTRESRESMDFLPLIYNENLFNMNFQFVHWLVVFLQNDDVMKIDDFMKIYTHFNFLYPTMILKSYFMFVEILYWYEIILEFLQFWRVKRVFQAKN